MNRRNIAQYIQIWVRIMDKVDNNHLNKKGIGWLIWFNFMFLFFGPYELIATNVEEFEFGFADVAFGLIGIMLLMCVVSGVILLLCPVKVKKIIVKIVVILDIMFYIQYFLNGQMGLLDGTNSIGTKKMVFNMGAWSVVLGVAGYCIFVRHMESKKYVWMLPYLCMLVQCVACVSLIPKFIGQEKEQWAFTNKEEFTISQNENIIVLVLDCFSNEVIQKMDEKELDFLRDFTFYDNANSVYEATFTSFANLLTGQPYDTTCSYLEWGNQIWEDEKCSFYYDKLKEKNYKVHLYTDDLLECKDPVNIASKVDNYEKIENQTKTINYLRMEKLFVKSSCFKFFPSIVKTRFYVDGDMMNECVDIPEGNEQQKPIKRNAEYYQVLRNQGLRLNDDSNYMIVQHLRGLHPPYNIDDTGKYVEDGEQMGAAQGCLLVVDEYLNLLKQLEKYDDSIIIVMSDHGNQKQCEGVQPIFFVKNRSEKHNQMVVNSAPISYEDFMPTIMKCIGVDTKEKTIYDFVTEEKRNRVMYIRGYDEKYPEVERAISGGKSSINILYKYEYTGDSQTLNELEKEKKYEVVPLSEYPN